MLDLGAWAEERYAIAASSGDTDTAGLESNAGATDPPPVSKVGRAE